MAIAMITPAGSAAVALTGTLAQPRSTLRITFGVLLTVLALAGFFASWWFGVEAVNSAR